MAVRVGRTLEWLEVAKIINLLHAEVLAVAQPEATEAIASAFRFEECLRDYETEATASFDVVVEADIGEQHCEVFLPAAEPRGGAAEREEAVVLPESPSLLTV